MKYDALADFFHSLSPKRQAELKERQAREWDTLPLLVRYYRWSRALYVMRKPLFVAGLLLGGIALAVAGYATGTSWPVLIGAVLFGVAVGTIFFWELDK